MTISVDPDIADQIRAEAARDGVDVSTWMARTAKAESTRRAYAQVLAERRAAGVYSDEWTAGFAQRRAALQRFRAGT